MVAECIIFKLKEIYYEICYYLFFFITNPKNYIKNVGISNYKYFRKNITVSSRFSAKD